MVAPRPPVKQEEQGMRRTAWGADKKAIVQNEKAFQEQVIELAQYLGWWPWHPQVAKFSPKGYPDLTLFRERVLFVELKARDAKGRMGKLMPEQVEMAHRCFRAKVEYYHWTTDDWEVIKEVLSRGGTVTAS